MHRPPGEFLRGVAGGADHRLAADARIGLLRGSNRGGSRIGVEMHAVGAGIQRDLSGTVDQDARGFAGGADGCDDARSKRLELGEGKILFAGPEWVDAAAGHVLASETRRSRFAASSPSSRRRW